MFRQLPSTCRAPGSESETPGPAGGRIKGGPPAHARPAGRSRQGAPVVPLAAPNPIPNCSWQSQLRAAPKRRTQRRIEPGAGPPVGQAAAPQSRPWPHSVASLSCGGTRRTLEARGTCITVCWLWGSGGGRRYDRCQAPPGNATTISPWEPSPTTTKATQGAPSIPRSLGRVQVRQLAVSFTFSGRFRSSFRFKLCGAAGEGLEEGSAASWTTTPPASSTPPRATRPSSSSATSPDPQIGSYFRRCLERVHRGASGREKVDLPNRVYVVVRPTSSSTRSGSSLPGGTPSLL